MVWNTLEKKNVDMSTHDDAIQLLRQYSLSTLVEREIERQIISGEVTSGSKLNEVDIANLLRVSRGPVREALRSLEQVGLVYNEKNRGVFVRQISIEEADQIYEVRAALDGLIGKLAAERALPAQIKRLKKIIREMKVLRNKKDPIAYFPLNIEFHEVLANMTNNKSLISNYRRITNELTLYRRETLVRNVENIEISTKDHEDIVNAIEKGDGNLAQKLLYDHVIESRNRLHKVLL
jgi:phosphonate utilization transcriptional regulator